MKTYRGTETSWLLNSNTVLSPIAGMKTSRGTETKYFS